MRRATATARCPCPSPTAGRAGSRRLRGPGLPRPRDLRRRVGGPVVDDDHLVDEADLLDQMLADGGDDRADRGLLVPRGKTHRHDRAGLRPHERLEVQSRTHGGMVEVSGRLGNGPVAGMRRSVVDSTKVAHGAGAGRRRGDTVLRQERAHPERPRDRPDDAAATSFTQREQPNGEARCQCLNDEQPESGLPLEALESVEKRRCSSRPTMEDQTNGIRSWPAMSGMRPRVRGRPDLHLRVVLRAARGGLRLRRDRGGDQPREDRRGAPVDLALRGPASHGPQPGRRPRCRLHAARARRPASRPSSASARCG